MALYYDAPINKYSSRLEEIYIVCIGLDEFLVTPLSVSDEIRYRFRHRDLQYMVDRDDVTVGLVSRSKVHDYLLEHLSPPNDSNIQSAWNLLQAVEFELDNPACMNRIFCREM